MKQILIKLTDENLWLNYTFCWAVIHYKIIQSVSAHVEKDETCGRRDVSVAMRVHCLEWLCVHEMLSVPLRCGSLWQTNHSVSQQPRGLSFAYSIAQFYFLPSSFLAVYKSAGRGSTTHHSLPTEVVAWWSRALACWWMYSCSLHCNLNIR